jgi:endonuclease/exonuclease/phosphatase (EEP) superfamily protein YafD
VVELRSGKKIKFHGVHPVAPFPSEKYPDNVGMEEVALSKVGNLAEADTLPSIVAGDFNDVSWSKSTRFFEKSGNLKNVRLGRGLYNSFSAKSFFMRWPLDHFFVTEEFGAVKIERLPKFGSDHFPIIAELVLQ